MGRRAVWLCVGLCPPFGPPSMARITVSLNRPETHHNPANPRQPIKPDPGPSKSGPKPPLAGDPPKPDFGPKKKAHEATRRTVKRRIFCQNDQHFYCS